MEHNNNHNHQNGGGSGFLLGVIVGVILTLLFTTKRGRAILRDVLERGVEKFANLEEIMRETVQDAEEEEFMDEEGDDFIPAEPVTVPAPVNQEPEKKIVEEAPKPQPVKDTTETIKEVKTAPSAPEKKEEKAPAALTQIEEKTKASKNKRWFRGLRKKG